MYGKYVDYGFDIFAHFRVSKGPIVLGKSDYPWSDGLPAKSEKKAKRKAQGRARMKTRLAHRKVSQFAKRKRLRSWRFMRPDIAATLFYHSFITSQEDRHAMGLTKNPIRLWESSPSTARV